MFPPTYVNNLLQQSFHSPIQPQALPSPNFEPPRNPSSSSDKLHVHNCQHVICFWSLKRTKNLFSIWQCSQQSLSQKFSSSKNKKETTTTHSFSFASLIPINNNYAHKNQLTKHTTLTWVSAPHSSERLENVGPTLMSSHEWILCTSPLPTQDGNRFSTAFLTYMPSLFCPINVGI